MGLPAVALLLTAAGTAVSVYGQVKAGRAAKKSANEAATEQERGGRAQREVAEDVAALSDYNAQVSEMQKQDAIERGAEAESRYRTQVRGVIGTQRAIQAGGNIDVSFGSAVDVQADAAFLGEMDALQIRTNAAREGWGYAVQAEDYRRRGAIARKEGVNAELAARANARGTRAAGSGAATANYLGAAGTLLSGGSTLLQMAYAFKK